MGLLDPVFIGLSYAGSIGLIWVALSIAAAILLRRPTLFPLIVLGVVASDLLATGLKNVFDVERPIARFPEPEPLVRSPMSFAFPSGHAATSFAAATLLAWAIPRLTVPLYALATAIAFSRVYVGVHYPLDIVGGALLGLVVATALRLLGRARRRSLPAQRAG